MDDGDTIDSSNSPVVTFVSRGYYVRHVPFLLVASTLQVCN